MSALCSIDAATQNAEEKKLFEALYRSGVPAERCDRFGLFILHVPGITLMSCRLVNVSGVTAVEIQPTHVPGNLMLCQCERCDRFVPFDLDSAKAVCIYWFYLPCSRVSDDHIAIQAWFACAAAVITFWQFLWVSAGFCSQWICAYFWAMQCSVHIY